MLAHTDLVVRADEIAEFYKEISVESNVSLLTAKSNDFVYSFPPEVGMDIATHINWRNPFYLPDIPPNQFENLKVNNEQLAAVLLRLRMTANRANQLNVLVACPPKSASTFIQAALRKGLNLPSASLTVGAQNSSQLGANLKEQEIDEVALLRAGLNEQGYVAQHHMRMCPYVAKMLDVYEVKPIVTSRNLFDTLVSMDDMFKEYRSKNVTADGYYFSDGLPNGYHEMTIEDRLSILAHRQAAWLVQFYVSWKKCEAFGMVKPCWISYEEDFLGDKKLLIAKILSTLGTENLDPKKLVEAFMDKSDAKSKRINKGIAGRGEAVPENVREFVLQVVAPYRDEFDFSPLVGENNA